MVIASDWAIARAKAMRHTDYHGIAEELTDVHREATAWRPIAEAEPNIWYEVAGPSGYMGVPIRVHVARLVDRYRDNNMGWRTSDGSCFTDDGEPPTHFRELTVPEGY